MVLYACAVQCGGIKMASTEAGSTQGSDGHVHTAAGLDVQSYLPGSASLVEDLDSKMIFATTVLQ